MTIFLIAEEQQDFPYVFSCREHIGYTSSREEAEKIVRNLELRLEAKKLAYEKCLDILKECPKPRYPKRGSIEEKSQWHKEISIIKEKIAIDVSKEFNLHLEEVKEYHERVSYRIYEVPNLK